MQEEAKLQQVGVARLPDPVQRPPGMVVGGGGQPAGMVAMQQQHGGTPQQAGMPQQQAMSGLVGVQQWRPGMQQQQQQPGALQQQQQRPMYLQNQGQRQTMQSLQQLIQVPSQPSLFMPPLSVSYLCLARLFGRKIELVIDVCHISQVL